MKMHPSIEGVNVHIDKHFSAAPPLFQKAPVKVSQVFKDVFMVTMANEQGYFITDRRNTLRNPSCVFLWPLEIVVVCEWSVSEYVPKIPPAFTRYPHQQAR